MDNLLSDWLKMNGNLPGDNAIHKIKTLSIITKSSDSFTYNVPSGQVFNARFLNATARSDSTYSFTIDGSDITEEDTAKSEPIQAYGSVNQIWMPPKQAYYTVTITINNTSGSTQTYNCSINGYLRKG